MMTNKEAIIFLSKVKQILLKDNSWLESTKTPITESFDMAISALEASTPCDLCTYNPPSSRDGKPCSCCPAEPYMEDEW